MDILRGLAFVVILLYGPATAFAQAAPPPAAPQPEHVHVPAAEGFVNREASGTAWLPDTTAMHGFHREWRGWSLMAHGNVFAQYLYESGELHRRSQQLGSINWFMGMAARPVATGRVGVRVMVSLEPWTIRGCGYPNLLATGEVCNQDSIHDLQHPHDLFMELAAFYERPLARSLRWQVYAGLAGEPALGPPGFPHRPSALPNPVAPIAHHWLDSTHITFGLVTTGLVTQTWKAEVSAFNSREPDEARGDLDLGKLDSVSGRIALMPSDRLALQVSVAHLRESEAGLGPQPRSDVNRVTASAIYHRPMGTNGLWATTAAYGMNTEWATLPVGLIFERTHAALVETSLSTNDRHTWFGRAEIVGKPAHDLHIHEYITRIFTVGKLQAGYVRHLTPWKGWLPGIGGSIAVSVLPRLIAPRYAGRIAPGLGLFLTVRPTMSGA